MKTAYINFENYLKKIVEKQPESIAQFIAKCALETKCPKEFLKHLSYHGCTFGIREHAIFYKNVPQFFNDFYDEIEISREYQEIEIPYDCDLRSCLVWTTIEIVAGNICEDWENGS